MKKIKSYIHKYFRRTDFNGLSLFGRGQHFDWQILLVFFLLVMVVSISFSVHIFLGVRAGDIFSDDFKPPVHNSSIDKALLDRILADFSTRATTLKNLQTQKPVFVDPSL